MENWTKRILLMPRAVAYVSLLMLGCISSVQAMEKPQSQIGALVEPDVKPIVVDESLIDTENFELGAFTGVMHIEDFESAFIMGGRLSYHLDERFAFEVNVGMTEAGETSFEKLGNVELLSDEERDYLYYSFGLNLKIPGESYYASSFALNNNFYLHLGMGTTDFAGDKRLTGIFGLGYQLLLNDFMSVHVSAKEHLYKIDVVGAEKMTYNSEYTLGLSFFF